MLADAFGTELPQPAQTVCGMGMVQLPDALVVNDVPGVPGTGVRHTLRERYNIEAAIGTFPVAVTNDGRVMAAQAMEEGGTFRLSGSTAETRGFVRLSHAVYNRPEEYELFRDAVLELTAEGES